MSRRQLSSGLLWAIAGVVGCAEQSDEGVHLGKTEQRVELGCVASADCGGMPIPGCSAATRYIQTWDCGPEGWLSKTNETPFTTVDPTSPAGEVVQSVTRATTGGDYFSPLVSVDSGGSYCLRAYVKWNGGYAPFIGYKTLTNGTLSSSVTWAV